MNPIIELDSKHARLRGVALERFAEICAGRGLKLNRNYFEVLYSTACWLTRFGPKKNADKLLVAISGAQGSGKTTFTELLADLLGACLDYPALTLSLDDFYLTRLERQELARTIHPLLVTRGVPGTHDVDLLKRVIQRIQTNQPVRSPRFSKSEDDRQGDAELKTDSVKVVLLEGWCWGAQAVGESELHEAMNELEADEDTDCSWRLFVNSELGRYRKVFMTDISIFLAVPDMTAVFDWRLQQEQALPEGAGVMSDEDIHRFIMYYERITRRMLLQMPEKADLTLYLGSDHEFDEAVLGKP